MRLLQRLFGIFAAWLVCLTQAASAQTSPAVRLLNVSVQSSVAAFAPFEVTLNFTNAVCVRDTALLAGARATANKLTIGLANLTGSGDHCTDSKRFVWPGLPPGQYALEVGLGRFSYWPTVNAGSTSVLSSSVTTSISVLPESGVVVPAYLLDDSFGGAGYRWRLGLRTGNLATSSGVPINLTDDATLAPMPSMSVWSATTPSAATTPLFELSYPLASGDSRIFYTTSAAERDTLLGQGFKSLGSPFNVVAAVGGACATGLRPIYRLYQQALTIHKFVGTDTHALLAASGWISEKIAFCAAPDIDRASFWQSN